MYNFDIQQASHVKSQLKSVVKFFGTFSNLDEKLNFVDICWNPSVLFKNKAPGKAKFKHLTLHLKSHAGYTDIMTRGIPVNKVN